MGNSGVTSLNSWRKKEQFLNIQLLKIPGKDFDWSSVSHSPSPRGLIDPAWVTVQARDQGALIGSSPKV